MAVLTFVTTCRGRLAHIRETLPSLVRQPDAAVIVVDYGCPDLSGDWVQTNFPSVEVVRSPESSRFELARARNIGAAHVRSPWICFIDADTSVTDDFCERINPMLEAGCFYQAGMRHMEIFGTSICTTADFERIGGYDEVIQGWGKEDEDFYARLFLAGLRYARFPGDVLRAITHADDERVAHYDIKDRWVSESINHVYCRAKLDLMQLLHRPLALDMRKKLYAQIHDLVVRAREHGKPATIALPLPAQATRVCGPIEARLVYTLPRPRGDGTPKTVTGSLVPRSVVRRRENQ